MGLTATGRRSISRLGIDPLSIAGPLAVVFGWDIDAMPVAGQLLHGERRGAHSAGKTFLIAAMRHNQELSYASSYRSSRR